MELSNRKIEANRRNALRSTGPKTRRGKDVSRFNALTHGLLARAVVIPTGRAKEKWAGFKWLLGRLRRELHPEGIREELLVERIAVAYWRKRRALRSEVGEIQAQVETVADDLCDDEVGAEEDLGGKLDPKVEETWSKLDRAAVRQSPAGLDYLIGVLKEVRRHVKRFGELDWDIGERLLHCFGNAPDGFAVRCAEFVELLREDAEEAAAGAATPQAERYARELLRLVDGELEKLKAEKAQLVSTLPDDEASPQDKASPGPSVARGGSGDRQVQRAERRHPDAEPSVRARARSRDRTGHGRAGAAPTAAPTGDSSRQAPDTIAGGGSRTSMSAAS